MKGPLPRLPTPHFGPAREVLAHLETTADGLEHADAAERLKQHGPNTLPSTKPPGITQVFLRQFKSPLIYVLVTAALVSVLIQEWSDALFIGAVLLLNAIIGTAQEYSAQRAAAALQALTTTTTRVLRGGDTHELDAEALVPGDIVLLESGDRVPADVRLLACHDLQVDESLLTGESIAVQKDVDARSVADSAVADRTNMTFAGTLVNRGRASGVVVATALETELGRIASDVLGKPAAKAPLLVRMEKFTHWVALLVGCAALLMAAVALARGMPLNEIFLLAVALAVSVIPEGLPVALTVALAISMRRMARRKVIVRKLMAVEALGSCTFIVTDKTGTLTVNQLTGRRILFSDGEPWEVTGASEEPVGEINAPQGEASDAKKERVYELCRASVLVNEGTLAHRDGGWARHGDAVDVALLVMAHKAGIVQAELRNRMPEIATLPFESEHLYAASLNDVDGVQRAFVKGALERLLPMCSTMATRDGAVPLDVHSLEERAHGLASQGYRVIALAAGDIELPAQDAFSGEHLSGLTLLGLVGMIDPLRPETKAAVAACSDAGIRVAMVTGDHPATALAIARELQLAESMDDVVTGPILRRATDDVALGRLTEHARVFARVEPRQKLDIVRSLQRHGHFVAVSGDGANDAPALRAAEVGVAMGRTGTDVAREASELIIADDHFASIVAGVEEGRVAYANVRKVIFLLISTGASELVLFTLALVAGLPLPLLAVQLLWLNLVTNGIQDVALAFEPAEGHELSRPPRPPREAIFNRLMLERVVISSLVIGTVTFLLFRLLLERGVPVEEARNGVLMLMVLFENIHVFNCRSESRSTFRHNLLQNPVLLFGTLAAQSIHVAAMYTPWLRDVLRMQPVTLVHWLELLLLSLSVLVVMEVHKAIRRRV